MDFNEPTNYYDVLDIRHNASPSEVREAYYRAKSAYNKDSVAIYSLIDPSEREDILSRIEEAYEILSSEEKRKSYDENQGIIETTGIIQTSHSASHSTSMGKGSNKSADVVSIDRVPPMESFDGTESEALLVAPTTDFDYSRTTPNPTAASLADASTGPVHSSHLTAPQNPVPRPPARPQNTRADDIKGDVRADIKDPRAEARSEEESLTRAIETENEWRGSFIRHVREAQNVSIEEMSNITKVSKTYLLAIEEENFKKLPALVFVRGFLTQIARILRIPQDKLLGSYLARFKAAKQD
jgi:curved DNA-binding protein CbpA